MKKIALTEVCDFQGGTQPPKNEWSKHPLDGYVRMLQIRDFTQSKDDHIEYVRDSKSLRKCNKDDILIGRYGASIGKILTGLSGAYNVALVKTVPDKSKIESAYLGYILKGHDFQSFVLNIGARAAQAGFNKAELKDFFITLPPLPEQRRIAHLLDKADALRHKNKQLLAAYDELLKATFLEMFGDPVRNEKGWETLPFNKCGQFISGATPSKGNKSYWEGSFPWVSPKDMKTEIISDAQDHISEDVFKETNLKRIPPNHLLIVVRGMILAHSFPVAINSVDVAINQDMKAIRPIEQLNVHFLKQCLKSLKRQLIDLMSSAGHGTKKFDAESMERLFIPVPPLTLQAQFVRIAENIEAQKAMIKKAMQESDDMFNGLVQEVFG